MMRAIASFRSRMRSAARRMIFARSQAGIAFQVANPFAALASTAAMSAEAADGIVPMSSSVAGEWTGIVAPESAGRHWLSMRMPFVSYTRRLRWFS